MAVDHWSVLILIFVLIISLLLLWILLFLLLLQLQLLLLLVLFRSCVGCAAASASPCGSMGGGCMCERNHVGSRRMGWLWL